MSPSRARSISTGPSAAPKPGALRALAALAVIAGSAVIAGVSCGGGQTQGAAFDPTQSDDGAEMAALQQQLATVELPRGADVAVGVFGERALFGVPLKGGEAWTFEHPISCRPAVAGSIVVGIGANELFGLDAMTGKLLWTRKTGGSVRGIADDGKVTIVSVQPVTGHGAILLAIGRDGQVMRQVEDDSIIGVPAIIEGYAFLPWEGRYVSAYDFAGGEEVARVRLHERVSRAFVVGGAMFFGERTATRFDEHIGTAWTGRPTTVGLPSRELPGSPVWMAPGNESLPPAAQPSDRIRLYARPSAPGPAAIVGGHYVATHGKVAMGLSAKDGAIQWVHAHAASFLGGAAYDGGFALCDAEGQVTFFDAETGAAAGSASLGVPVDACLVQADGFTWASSAKGERAALRDQIAGAIRLQDEEAAPVQRFLLKELAASPDERATETLIQLVTSGAVEEEIAADVRAALAARRTGASAMLAELAKRYDYLEGTERTRALVPLSEALAAMNEKAAAPVLALHLSEPSTPDPEIERVAAALEVLAGPGEVPALRAFFAAYRSEAQDTHLIAAVVHVAHALERLGFKEIVEAAKVDPFTSDAVRSKLSAPSSPPH